VPGHRLAALRADSKSHTRTLPSYPPETMTGRPPTPHGPATVPRAARQFELAPALGHRATAISFIHFFKLHQWFLDEVTDANPF
jgi:hypothetical protein